MDKRLTRENPEREAALRRELFEGLASNTLTLAEAVKKMQRVSRLTQVEFARHRGVSVEALKQIISGKGNPTVDTLNTIVSVFGLEVGFVPKKKA